jgi:CD109 antigen
MRKQVPDTITSWVISGFSLDPLFGLGLSETPRKVSDKTEVFYLLHLFSFATGIWHYI